MTINTRKASTKKAKPVAAKKAAKSSAPAASNRKKIGAHAPASGKGPTLARAANARPALVSRALANIDDDDALMASGGGGGAGFGRCGGRLLASRLEQDMCNRLGMAGVVHSHSPRHYEIRFDDKRVAAYAPMIVLRGRGREGKGIVIEAIDDGQAPILEKVTAFRSQYGQEFYVILVGTDEALEEAPTASHDESCSAINLNTLIARLAE
jgi:hypothetical protein